MQLIKKIFYIFLGIFLIYVVIEIVKKIIGGSLSFEALIIALLIDNIGYSFLLKDAIGKIDSKFNGHIGWHKGKNNSKSLN